MYITQKQLDDRLTQTEISVQEIQRKVRGKENRLTHEDRVMIGVMSEVMSNKDVAELTGVSEQTVSLSSRGITSPTLGVDKDLRDEVDAGVAEVKKTKEDKMNLIKDQLITNLAAAIGHVGNNIQRTDATEASKIAVDMSKILDKVSGNGDRNTGSRVAIVINVPTMKEEKSYQTIDA